MVNIHKILSYKKDNMSYLKKLKLISIFILTSLIFVSTANAKYASFVINENTKRIYHNTNADTRNYPCLLYTSPSPRDLSTSRMPSSA